MSRFALASMLSFVPQIRLSLFPSRPCNAAAAAAAATWLRTLDNSYDVKEWAYRNIGGG